MRYNIAAKNFQIPVTLLRHINFHLQKISQRLPNIKHDMFILSLYLKKRSHKYFNQDRKKTPIIFEGSIIMRLPKKPLFVTFKGRTLSESLDLGVKRLKKELQTYKQLQYKSQSKYPNHNSIRKSLNE